MVVLPDYQDYSSTLISSISNPKEKGSNAQFAGSEEVLRLSSRIYIPSSRLEGVSKLNNCGVEHNSELELGFLCATVTV